MNPETLLNEVQTAIDNREPTTETHYHIGVSDGKIVCIPKDHRIGNGKVFGTYNHNELKYGLTTQQWNNLQRKLSLHIFGRKNK